MRLNPRTLFALAGALGLWGCASSSPSPSAHAASELPQCRQARMLCDEARGGSAGMREFCIRAAGECRAAQDSVAAAQAASPH